MKGRNNFLVKDNRSRMIYTYIPERGGGYEPSTGMVVTGNLGRLQRKPLESVELGVF